MSSHILRGFTSLVHSALGLVLIATHSLQAAEAELRPLLQRDQWQFEDPAAWEWQGDGNATTLVLRKPSHYTPKVRRPFNLAWFGGAEWGSFTLTCEARLDVFNKGNNDLCIAFAERSDSEFYYAHLGETADAVHLQLHLVNNADRKPITTNRAKALPWQPNHWHHIKLVRDASSGGVKIWFDDELVLEGIDKTFGKGRLGLGSFDDLGAFRNVVITPGIASAIDTSSARIEIVAGGGVAVENAPATECKVTQPFGIAFDPKDNMFICEETHRILRVDAKTGVLTVVSSAKPKGAPLGDNGPAKDASFIAPHNLVADAEGNLFVADTYQYAVRRIDAKTGIVTTFAGNGSKELTGDGGPATSAGLDGIACLCFNRDFTKLYLGGFSKVIRVVDMKTGVISTVPGIGGSRAMAVDSNGRLFTAAGRGLRMLGTDGKAISLEDPSATPPLNGVKHLWADRDDNILIADAGNHLIRKFIVSERKLVTIAGVGTKGASGVPGPPLLAQLGEPHGVVTHPRTGEIYIADSRNHRVLRIKASPAKPLSAP
jgi:DNA-binding beta-propeller fold protein YncE